MNITKEELYWLAGILEGEAHFYPQNDKHPLGITVEMTDEDIIQRITSITGNTYCKVKVRQPHHKQSYKTTLRGKPALKLMMEILPLMGKRRSEKINECISSFLEKEKGKITKVQVDEILDRKLKGENIKELAKQFNITHWRIYQLARK